jgi:tRNA G10  N-methylase Trm11
LNILGVGRGSRVLEPYLGSGTAAVEASLLGANVVGVDVSPLCVLLTQVKTQAWTVAGEIRKCVEKLLARPALTSGSLRAPRGADPLVEAFLEIAKLVTASDVARRSREEEPSLRRNLAGMLESVEAYANAVREFGLRPGTVRAEIGDCRDLSAAGVKAASIDAIVTSPPYSIALDYVKNDDHALKAMRTDIEDLRNRMTGVRGRGAHEKLQLYNADMQQMFREVARVLKPRAAAAFVIGDATVNGREVTTTNTMITWAQEAGLQIERSIPKIVFGLYNVMQDERILIFRKP